ncbi:11478_t:CDS:2 [Funneliformis geosporum]|uniref:11478_t:CDS:1 n=1 Tax=Funneliformis geosporum TaxID=1117311 RepID=A0A9W4STC2_9GLOM|nr:11478_t:CDS:2 [Funneliformis geosporum]
MDYVIAASKYALEKDFVNPVFHHILNKIKVGQVPYKNLFNFNYLAKGGFSTLYKAEWIQVLRINMDDVDSCHPSHGGFGQIFHHLFHSLPNIDTDNYSKKKNGDSDNFDYKRANRFGSIYAGRYLDYLTILKNMFVILKYLDNSNFTEVFLQELDILHNIAVGLKIIHQDGLIHKDLHPGNILKDDFSDCYIADFGLCKPVDEQSVKQDDQKIYGVLPYVAPEVLRGKVYTQESDIYSFGMVAYEIVSGLRPYHFLPHEDFLAVKICEGVRPKFDDIKIPPFLENLIDQCLNADPLKRP